MRWKGLRGGEISALVTEGQRSASGGEGEEREGKEKGEGEGIGIEKGWRKRDVEASGRVWEVRREGRKRGREREEEVN